MYFSKTRSNEFIDDDMSDQLEKKFDFRGLFILEMANNHQGSVEHGKRIIDTFAALVHKAGVKGAIKFQFRNLDTIVHPSHKQQSDNKHIPRFLSTRLTKEQFCLLRDAAREAGLIPMTTPWDEDSVELAEQLGMEIIKIGSSSAADWPLLERVVAAGKPIVCSTAGLPLEKVDNLVSFFDHRGANYALMHCVSIYPTPNHKLNLRRIDLFRERYPHVTIGFSTHEDPNNVDAIQIAYAKGAELFERHIGIETDEIKLNAYSSRPEQFERWLQAYQDVLGMTTPAPDPAHIHDPMEVESLASLMRGVYAKNAIAKNNTILQSDVYFAMPFQIQAGQLHSGQWRPGLVAERDYVPNEPLPTTILPDVVTNKEIIYKAIHDVKGALNEARIHINHESSVELLHPLGVKNFFTVGAFMIHCFNREYSKKIIILLPGQRFPSSYQKKNEATIQIMVGQLEVDLAGQQRTLYPGDTLLIPPGVWHAYKASGRVIFEEISTTLADDETIYVDPAMQKLLPEEKRTRLHNWGRHQFD